MSSGSRFINERQQGIDRLVDIPPLLGSLIFVIVRRIGRFGYPLKSCDRGNRAAILRRNIPGNDPGQSPMIAFDAHDSSSGDTEISRTKVANTDQVSRNERVF